MRILLNRIIPWPKRISLRSFNNRTVQKMPLKESSAVPWIKPQPPTFSSKQEERQFLKGRLALAFRIFSLKGYEEGLAGHITVKVSWLLLY